jgi:O-acetyl-ADP-ribose deacetylase (regulator of RNase III)
MIVSAAGNLFESSATVLVNPVNTVGVMGAGLALVFRQKYPAMFADYAAACRRLELPAGGLHLWQSPTGTWVVNLATKQHWKAPSKLEWVEEGLTRLALWLKTLPSDTTVAVPALGCGLGNLRWEEVEPRIVHHLSPLSQRVEVYAPVFSSRPAIRSPGGQK